jgi:hypothetical protein
MNDKQTGVTPVDVEWRAYATGSAGFHTRRFLFLLTALVTLGAVFGSQSAVSAPFAATWGLAEVHGGTLAQRSLAREAAAHLSGQSFVMDKDALSALCARVRERAAQSDVQCSLVFSNVEQVHYLVEIPGEVGASAQTIPDAFDDVDAVLPAFLVKLQDRFFEAYQANLGSLRSERYVIRGGRMFFGVPALDQSSAALAQAVPANTNAILNVLTHAADPEQRALAGFLLGWSSHREETLRQSLSAFHDPDTHVRNNYSMILAFSAPALSESFQQQLATSWCEAIARPVFTDRSKALLGLSRIRPKLRHALPDQCKDIVALIGRETALAEIRRMAAIITTTH